MRIIRSMTTNDKDLTKAELVKGINQMKKVKGNPKLWNSFSKHMKGAFIYRLGKFERLLKEKN